MKFYNNYFWLSRLLAIFFCSSIHAQKIEQSKKDLNKNNTSTASSSSSNSYNDNKSNYNSTSDNLFIDIFLYLSYYALIGNHNLEGHLQNKLTPHPYADDNSGNYTDSSNSKNFRLDMENNLLTEKLSSNYSSFGNHFKLKARVKQYLYGQFDQISLFEKYKGNLDNLAIYQFNLGYDRLRFKKFNFGFLIGATHIGNNVKKTGLTVGLHTDIFFIKKFSLDSSIHWFSINNETVRTFDIKGKFHKKNIFFNLGIENMKIGKPSYNYLATGFGLYL